MENAIVALSNIYAIFPIYNTYKQKDYISCATISFVSLASFTSHLFESHKHGMWGFGCPQDVSYMLNRFDVIGSFLTSARVAYILYNNMNKLTTKNIIMTGIAFMFLRVSEYDKYNEKLKWMYIPTHCIWHYMVFKLLNDVLQD